MPSPRPPGSGVEKILISPHKIPEDHVLHLVVFTRGSPEPGVGFLASSLRLFFLLGGSSPGLSLAAFRTPLPFSPRRCYDTLLISLIVRVPSFTHAWDSFLLSPLLMTCPYDASSIMQTFYSYSDVSPGHVTSFLFHLFLDGPLLLRTISLLFSDDASPGRVIHYAFLLTHTMTRP